MIIIDLIYGSWLVERSKVIIGNREINEVINWLIDYNKWLIDCLLSYLLDSRTEKQATYIVHSEPLFPVITDNTEIANKLRND